MYYKNNNRFPFFIKKQKSSRLPAAFMLNIQNISVLKVNKYLYIYIYI